MHDGATLASASGYKSQLDEREREREREERERKINVRKLLGFTKSHSSSRCTTFPCLYFSPCEPSISLLTRCVDIQSGRESTAFDSLSGRVPLGREWARVSEVLLGINRVIRLSREGNETSAMDFDEIERIYDIYSPFFILFAIVHLRCKAKLGRNY